MILFSKKKKQSQSFKLNSPVDKYLLKIDKKEIDQGLWVLLCKQLYPIQVVSQPSLLHIFRHSHKCKNCQKMPVKMPTNANNELQI